MTTTDLMPVDQFDRMLAVAKTPAESKRLEVIAATAKAYHKEQGDFEGVVKWSRRHINSRRHTTDLITPQIKNGDHGLQGDRRNNIVTAVLDDFGLSRMQWYRRCQELEIDEFEIDNYIDECIEKHVEPTVSGLLRFVQANKDTELFEPQTFNIWTFDDRNSAFGIEYPGNIPGDIIQNLLWLYTQNGDTIIDPFAGGGVSHDVCQWWTDHMWPVLCLSLDAKPSRPEIQRHDITHGYPASAQGAALVFLDPPYWKQKRGDYEGGDNLADMSLDEFHTALEAVVRASLAVLKPGGRVALLIGATRDGKRNDHAAELLMDLRDLHLEERINVPYSTQQAAPYHITAAKNGKLLLNRYRDLMIWHA